jgi:hypothetical protein
MGIPQSPVEQQVRQDTSTEEESSAASGDRMVKPGKRKFLKKLSCNKLKGNMEVPSVIPRCAMRASRQPIRRDG